MIKYMTSYYGQDIEKVEIIRETSKQVVVKQGRAGEFEREQAKRSSYKNFFDTWLEAHTFLVNKQTVIVERLTTDLKDEKKNLLKLLAMKEPK